MKYDFRLHARPLENESIGKKHQKLIDGLITIKNCWGLLSDNYPTPDVGEELTADFSLTKFLGKGIKGTVWYRYRGGLRDESNCDDFIDLEFNPNRVDYNSLIEIALPLYIKSFQPYWGYIGDKEFTYIDFNASRNFNHRDNVLRIYQINYFDEELCNRAFKLNIKEVSERVKKIVERVLFIENGILIVANSHPISVEEAEKLNSDLKKALEI